MNEELLKYYEYLKGQKADVPETFESFNATLSDDMSARKYYDYLRQNDFDAPDSYESFQSTFNLKKKSLQDGIGDVLAPVFAEPQGGSQVAQVASTEPPIASPGDQGEILVNAPGQTDLGFMDTSKPVPGFVIPTEPTEFERQGAIRQEQALRKGLGIDGPDPMTAKEQAGSFAGSFNKPVVDMISSIPKAGAIVRRYVDVAMGRDPKPVQAYDMWKLGAAIDKKALELGITYTDPRNAGSFFGEGVPSGLGSVLAIMSAGVGGTAESTIAKTSVKELGIINAGKLAAKDLGKAVASRPVVAGANLMGIQEFQQAKAAGATDEMALDVYFKNLPIGATEAIPMERAFARIANFTGGLGQVVKASTIGALEEGTQEGLQQWLTNKVAAGTYDPKREPWKDLISSMGVGAFIGFFLPMLGKAGQMLTPEQQKETIATINEALKEEEVTTKVEPGDFTNLDKLAEEQAIKSNEKPQEQPAAVEAEGPVVPETTKEEALPVQAEPKEQVDKVQEILDNEDLTTQDIANEIEAIEEHPKYEELQAAVNKYRGDVMTDQEDYGMRGDSEQYEEEFLTEIKMIIGPESKPQEKPESKKEEEPPKYSVDVARLQDDGSVKRIREEVEGKPYKKYPSLGLFSHPSVSTEGYYSISEAESGIQVVQAKTKKEAEQKLDQLVTQYGGEEAFKGVMAEQIAKVRKNQKAKEEADKPKPQEEAFVPKDGWESHLIKAREYAVNLGIEPKGKGLSDLVGEIHRKLQEAPPDIERARYKALLEATGSYDKADIAVSLIKKAESEISVNQDRVLENAYNISKLDKKERVGIEHIAEAIHYEFGINDNWEDLKNVVKNIDKAKRRGPSGLTEFNEGDFKSGVERILSIGIKLPKEVTDAVVSVGPIEEQVKAEKKPVTPQVAAPWSQHGAEPVEKKERSEKDIAWIMDTRLPREKRGETVKVKLIRNGKEETVSMPANEVIADFKNRLGLKKAQGGKSPMEQLVDCFGRK